MYDAEGAFAPDAWGKFSEIPQPLQWQYKALGIVEQPPQLEFDQGLDSAGLTTCCYLLPPNAGIFPFLYPLLMPFIPYPLPLPPLPCDQSKFWSIGKYHISLDVQISAQFYTGLTTRFYEEKLERDGYDGEGEEMRVVVNCADGSGYLNNCYWNPEFETICFGTGYTNTPFLYGDIPHRNLAGALDYVAHEFSHAVTSSTSDLAYINESGALNESFSDMMACAVEYWASQLEDDSNYPGSFDWTIGEDVALVNDLPFLINFFSRSFERSLEDPSISYPPQPNTYPSDDPNTTTDGYWHPYCDTSDNGGVHINCGVPNKMFYLLSEGGIHNGVTVKGIGILDAALIMYRANRDQWNNDESFTFEMAKEGCITEANNFDIENGSNWSKSVQNAWAAVNIGEPYESQFSNQTISSGTYSDANIIIGPNVTIESGAIVIFNAENSIMAGDNVIINENAQVTFHADTIEGKNSFNVKSGAVVIFEAIDSLTIGPDFIIESDAEVYFRVGNYISILPDFTAQEGSFFEISNL